MCLIKNHITKTCGREEVQLHSFLNFALMEVSGHLHSLVTLLLGKDLSLPTEQGKCVSHSWGRETFFPLPLMKPDSLVAQSVV
jgi:hypothetical protein